MRRYLGYRPREVHGVYRLLNLAAAGRPGHGPVYLLLESAHEIGFAWDSAERVMASARPPTSQNACWPLPTL